MQIARLVAPFAPLVLASTAVLAQDLGEPGGPAPIASTSASASASAPAPSNAPIVLSAGVAPSAKPEAKVVHHDPPADNRTPRAWFGWQTLGVDVVAVATTAVLLRTMDAKAHLGIAIGAGALFLATGPILHAANGSGRALDSVLVRAGGLAIGAFAGAFLLQGFAGCSEQADCKLETVDFAAIGAGAGAVIGAIVDGTVYAWKPVPGVTAYVTPAVAHVRGGATFGFSVAY